MFNIEIEIHNLKLKQNQTLTKVILFAVLAAVTCSSHIENSLQDSRNYRQIEVVKRTINSNIIPKLSNGDENTACKKSLIKLNYTGCAGFCSKLRDRLEKTPSGFSFRNTNIMLLVLLVVAIFGGVFINIVHYYQLKPQESSSSHFFGDNYNMKKKGSRKAAKMKNLKPTGSILLEPTIGSAEQCEPDITGNAATAALARKAIAMHIEMQMLREHVEKLKKQHKSDTSISKFKKKGAIYIPADPDIPAAPVLPDNIILDKVTYDPTGNELYDIGSDVDDIELEPSSFLLSSEVDKTDTLTVSKKVSVTGKKKSKSNGDKLLKKGDDKEAKHETPEKKSKSSGDKVLKKGDDKEAKHETPEKKSDKKPNMEKTDKTQRSRSQKSSTSKKSKKSNKIIRMKELKET